MRRAERQTEMYVSAERTQLLKEDLDGDSLHVCVTPGPLCLLSVRRFVTVWPLKLDLDAFKHASGHMLRALSPLPAPSSSAFLILSTFSIHILSSSHGSSSSSFFLTFRNLHLHSSLTSQRPSLSSFLLSLKFLHIYPLTLSTNILLTFKL